MDVLPIDAANRICICEYVYNPLYLYIICERYGNQNSATVSLSLFSNGERNEGVCFALIIKAAFRFSVATQRDEGDATFIFDPLAAAPGFIISRYEAAVYGGKGVILH